MWIFRCVDECFVLFHFVQNLLSHGFHLFQTKGIVLRMWKVLIHGHILPNTLPAKILFVHKIEYILFFNLLPVAHRRDKRTGHPSLLTSTGIFVTGLETAGEGSFPTGVAHRIFKFCVVKIHFLVLLLLFEQSANKVSSLHLTMGI